MKDKLCGFHDLEKWQNDFIYINIKFGTTKKYYVSC